MFPLLNEMADDEAATVTDGWVKSCFVQDTTEMVINRANKECFTEVRLILN